jgi:GTP-binding protein HflX
MIKTALSSKRCLLLQVISPHTHRDEALNSFEELESLVATFGATVSHRIVQHRLLPNQSTYFGSGKLVEIKEYVKAEKIDIVIINDIVDAGQLFRFEKELWTVNPAIIVWDRADLILHIFEKHATTIEAKLQIELAKLRHMGPRIYGLGGTFFSRQAGGIGSRGAGESNIEIMKRHIKTHARKIQDKLDAIKQQKKKVIDRRSKSGAITVSLVGYTNSGKTTIFNRLTGRDKKAADKLFVTLDTTVGKMVRQGIEKNILITDTIGFIKDLPPQLLESFKTTLMETIYADVILHVVDGSDPHMYEKIEIVEKIIADLSIPFKKVQLIVNKVDRLTEEQKDKLQKLFPDRMPLFVSAKTGEGIENLQI